MPAKALEKVENGLRNAVAPPEVMTSPWSMIIRSTLTSMFG
jgi:hypothetical protein